MKAGLLTLLLGFVLTACPTPPVPDFTISLTPPLLNLKLETPDTVKVSVNRSGGFGGAVTLSLVGDTTKLESKAVTIPASSSEGTLEIVAHDGAKIGTSFPVIRAVSGELTRNETLALKLEVPVASVSGVVLKDNAGSKLVPQGIGHLFVTVNGSNLERVTAAKLGDSSLSILPGQTPASLSFNVSVTHGAPIGARPDPDHGWRQHPRTGGADRHGDYGSAIRQRLEREWQHRSTVSQLDSSFGSRVIGRSGATSKRHLQHLER
jgi:hypothetical protein